MRLFLTLRASPAFTDDVVELSVDIDKLLKTDARFILIFSVVV
jgi:hypothetical protein